jgi:hypothetical protein
MSKNMLSVCGQAAYKFEYKSVCKLSTFTHYPQNRSFLKILRSFTHFYASLYTRVCSQKCMQMTSVSRLFYTLYTAPTITTTLNN